MGKYINGKWTPTFGNAVTEQDLLQAENERLKQTLQSLRNCVISMGVSSNPMDYIKGNAKLQEILDQSGIWPIK